MHMYVSRHTHTHSYTHAHTHTHIDAGNNWEVTSSGVTEVIQKK